ncbi:MAG: YhdP family protein, partial [Polynucleobacter sp.]
PIINAELGLSKNRAQWDQFPPLENIRGTLRLRDEKAEFEDVHADLMGGTMQIISTVDSANKKLFTINGNANSNAIKSYFANAKLAANPFLMALGGKLNYKGSIAASSLAANLNLNFDLQNLSFDVPAPLKKEAGTALQAEITIQSTPGSKTKPHTVDWSGRIGDLISAQGNLIDGEASRQSIGVGVIAPKPTSDTNISMQLAELNADSWQTFLNSGSSKEGSSSNAIGLTDVAIGQFNAQIKNFIFLNRTWPDLNINASGKNNGLLARINSPALAGQVDLQLNSASGKPNKVSGKLSYLHVPQANSPKLPLNSEMSVVNPVSRPVSSQKTIRLLPDIDLTINDFTWAKGQLGVTTLKASNQGDRFQIDSLTVNNPEAKVSITGKWLEYAQVGNEHTSLDVEADISNLGVIISRWGNPNQIEGGVGKLTAKLDWQGSPFQPEWSSIAGQVNIDLSNGRLLEVDTGAVQLLNVLSLQSLLKFASFNEASTVRDLANKGTAFNSIISTFNIRNGVARTNQFNMELNQARVFMSGLISIPNQTQDLRVTIFPTLDATTGALALVAINPIAGLAALVGQYLLTNRINKAMESDYLIQGSWQTPQIIPLNQQGQPLDPSVMDSIRKRDLLRQQQEPAAAPLPRVSTSAQ